jgi:gliding motility-associated-like protein
MRKLILFITISIIISQSVAQNLRYWVNGTGNWNEPSHWSLTSGGLPGATLPDENTSVVFDANSGIGMQVTITMKSASACYDFTVSSDQVAFKGKSPLSIYGSVTITPQADFSKFKGDLVFASSNNQQINIQCELNSNMLFNNAQGNWKLESTLNTSKNISLESGSLDANNQNITCYAFNGSGTNSRALLLRNSVVNVTEWNFENSQNLQFNSGKSEILISKKIEQNFNPGDLKYNAVKPASSKAITSVVGTPTNATCPLNTYGGTGTPPSGGIYADGSILAVVNAGVGTFIISLRQYNPQTENFELVAGPVTGNNVTFSNLKSGNYYIWAKQNASDEPTPSSVIVVGPESLIVDIQVIQDVSCAGGSDLILSAVVAGGTPAYTYSWIGSFFGYTSTNQNTDEIGPDDYQVDVTDNHSCLMRDGFAYYPSDPNDDYTTEPLEISISNVTSASTCQGSTTGEITVGTVTGGTPDVGTYPSTGYGYAIRLDGSLAALVYADGNTISGLAAGTYEVWVTDGNGCDTEYSSTITVASIPAPTATINADGSVCAGSSYTVAVGQAVATNYSSINWITPDGTGSFTNGNTVTPTYTPSVADIADGSITLRMVVNGNETCTPVSDDLLLTIHPRPTASITPDPAETCAGTALAMNGNPAGGSGVFTTHAWTGAGATSLSSTISQTPNFTNNAAGNYALIYTVTDNRGCTGSDNITVTVQPDPTANAGGSGSTCQGVAYTVAGATAANGTILWTVQTGTGTITPGTQTTLAPTYTPGAGETGAVELLMTVTGAGVCAASTATDVFDLTVNALPVPTITGSNSVCLNSTQTYTTEAGMSAYSWTVSAGGTFIGAITGNSVQVNWTVAGPQSISVNYTNGNNCTATAPTSLAVTVNPNPTASITPDPAETCAGTALPMNGNPAGGSGIYTHAWSGSGTLIPTNTQNTSFSSATSGTFNITYTVTDDRNCSGSDNITVTVQPGPTANAGGSGSTCQGAAYTVAGATAANGTILWTVQTGTGTITPGTQTTFAPTYTPGAGETGAVELLMTVTGAGVCAASTATDVFDLTVNPLPVPTITGSNSVCLNSVQIYTTEAGMSAYSWSIIGGVITSGATTHTITVTWNTAGAQSISVNYTNGNSCTGAAPTALAVTVNPSPTTSITPDPAETCINQDLTLVGNPAGGTLPYSNHSWSEAGSAFLDDASLENPTFNCPTPGTYDLTYTVTDDNGCEGTDNITVTVMDGPTANAGIDTTVCYDITTYTIEDATATNFDSYSWTTSGTGTFDDANLLHPTYTPSDADRTALSVTLTLTVHSALCNDITDDMVLNFAEQLIASVGGVTPYYINSATTEINVSFWGTHQNPAQLGFYLLAPDGLTQIRLYQQNLDGDFCSLLTKNTFDSLTFSTTTTADLDFCDIPGTILSGTYAPAQNWNTLNGQDPAQGGWSLVITDNIFNRTGTLTRARITFKDINVNTGLEQEIIFDSKTISYPIKDNATTTYVVPIGLRTNCNGACDARAIVSVTGGTPPYGSYIWSDNTIVGTDTVDLCGGDYQVTVTDARGCESVALVSVLEPDPIVLAFDSTNVACFGDSTGMVKVTATDGVGTYTYKWSDGAGSTTAQVNNLPAGTYTVTVTDGNLCPAIGSVTITQPANPISVTYTTTPTNCNSATGSITLTPAGGTQFTVGDPYTYTWAHDPMLVGNVANGLAVGDYQVTIEDSLGCTLDTTITMVDNGDMLVTGFTLVNEISCAGSCDGEVQVDFTGGNGSYTFNWSGAGSTGTDISLTNVCGDSTYYVTVTDVLTSCVADSSFVVPQPDSLKIQINDQTDVLCFGDNSGTAEAAGVEGTSPYTYVWTNAAGDTLSTDAIATNLAFGYSYIEVKDAHLCTYLDSVYTDQPTELTATTDSTASGCGDSTGAVAVTPSGGTAPYAYLWDDATPGSTDSSVTNLPVGVYNVTVTDANDCQLFKSVAVIDTSDLVVTLDSIKNVSCFGGTDGAAYISINGAVDPYSVAWSNLETTEDITLLTAGNYSVTVTDNNLCSRVLDVTITEPTELTATANVLNEPLCFGTASGSAEVVPDGGTGPYSYLWPDGQTSAVAIDLANGDYTVTVTDANLCTTTVLVTLTEPDSITFGFEFIRTACGDSIGQINIANILGGTSPYTVDWASDAWQGGSYPLADSMNTDTIRNLWVANYVAIVTDGNGCVVRDSMNMTDTSKMSIKLDSLARVTCHGGDNGAIRVHAEDGSIPYIYTWLNDLDVTIDSDSLLNDAMAGTYRLQVTDAGQCQRDTAFTITEPTEIVNQWVFTDSIVCHGETTASLYALIAGGVPPYEYQWLNSSDESMSNDSSLTNVGPDRYYLTVTDANNCLYLDSIEIFEPSKFIVDIKDFGPTNCTDSTGWAKVTIEDRPDQADHLYTYSYNWYLASDPSVIIEGQTTDSISKLWVDSYFVVVTDNLGCSASDTILIQDISGLDFEIDPISLPTCLSINNGVAAIISVENGSAPFDYVWKFGTDTIATSDTARVLPVGTTNVFVIDDFGCRAVKALTMADDSVLAIDYFDVRNDYSTSGQSPNGRITVYAMGGVKDYSYHWENEDGGLTWDTQEISKLTEGNYYVTITDALSAGSCQITGMAVVESDSLRYDTVELTHIYCYGENTGKITIQGIGGYWGEGVNNNLDGYEYTWSHSSWGGIDSTGNTISGLEPGWYKFKIEETSPGTGVIEDSIEIINLSQPYIVDFIIDSTNCTINNGSIVIDKTAETGGTPSFTYFWSHDGWSDDSTGVSISNLERGYYSLHVVDSFGCNYYREIYLPDSSKISIDIDVYPVSCFGRTNGRIEMTPDLGSVPYIFNWQNADGSLTWTDEDISGLSAGNYYVSVTDQVGCQRIDSGIVTQPDAVTFDIVIQDTNTCYYDNSGSIEIANAIGGNGGPFNYNIDELGLSQSDPVFNDLPTATLTFIVIDAANDCREDSTITFLSKSPQMFPEFEIIDTASCNNFSTDGTMTVSVGFGYFDQEDPDWEGSPIAYYRWDDSESNDTLFEASAGTHLLAITDTLGCEYGFSSFMPAKTNVGVTAFVNPGPFDTTNYYCPNDTVKLFTDVLLDNITDTFDYIEWAAFRDEDKVLSDMRVDTLISVGDSSLTFVPMAFFNGCAATDTLYVGRYAIDSLIATIDEDKERIFVGNTINLNVIKPDIYFDSGVYTDTTHSFFWFPDNIGVTWLTSDKIINPTAKPSLNTLFTVNDTIRIFNSAFSDQICILTDTVSIMVLPEFNPSLGFTPNADGAFDTWVLPGIEGYAEVDVQIFNRWGGLVWEHSGAYQGNEWDGTNTKGKSVPSGTYFYIIKYSDSDSGTKTLTGHVTILR